MNTGQTIDTFIAIDWSATSGSSPKKPSKDAIWASRSSLASVEPVLKYFRTREDCLSFVKDEISHAKQKGEKILIGFDFAFGYPSGYQKALNLDNGWRQLISKFHCLVSDTKNRNNRFKVAAKLNSQLSDSDGPLWGCPVSEKHTHLISKKRTFPYSYKNDELAEFRYIDNCLKHKNIQSVWKIFYRASVGGQTIMGLPYLHKLLTHPETSSKVAVWPFETGLVPNPFKHDQNLNAVVVEIWPGIKPIDQKYATEIKDSGQVKTISEFMKQSFLDGRMAEMFCPEGLKDSSIGHVVETEEGWIFGVPFPNN